jgi:hypothetical protein
MVRSQPRQIVHKTLSEKTLHTKKELVDWLKINALSSISSAARVHTLTLTHTHTHTHKEQHSPV